MAGSFSPRDEAARRLIREALDKTLFVEAGAGTGKTTSLVDRVTKLVSSGRTTLDRISAITFTEAAASELRDRIRENLEHSASDDKMTDEERERCRRGVDDLDQASIQTLHGFAGALLRERPLEAGLPPSFETMDAISSELAFEEAWTEWVDSSLEEGSPHFQELSLAFSLGLSVSKMREVALKFHGNYDLMAEALFEDIPRPAPSVVRRLVDAVDELERLCDFSKLRESDALFAHVQPRLALIRRHSETEPDSPAAFRLLQRILPLKTRSGRVGDWEVSAEVGQNAGRYLKETLKELDETANEEIAQARQSALVPILRALKEFVLAYVEERKGRGKAEFHDLLVWARDLLRDNIEVRDHFRSRFSHLLIDEAQDTDPIQAEIAMFLAEDVPRAGGRWRPAHRLGANNSGSGQAVRRRGPEAVNIPLPAGRRAPDGPTEGAIGRGDRAFGAKLPFPRADRRLGELRLRQLDGGRKRSSRVRGPRPSLGSGDGRSFQAESVVARRCDGGQRQ